MTEVLARLTGISKRYGGVQALADASLIAHAGAVHGVLGENGAGKSTLLRVLGGLERPDAGEVVVAGEVRALHSPRDAWAAGIGMVHQHFTLVPTLSVMENLALGRRSSVGGLRLPMAELRSEIGALMERTGLAVPLEVAAGTLGVGSRQRVEILKALLRRPRILVLDEPTAVLTPSEVDALFLLLREMAEEGRAVILVAHKLDEVLAVADTVTVLRRGRTVLTARRDQTDVPRLILAMVGGGDADAAAVGHTEDEPEVPSAPEGRPLGEDAAEIQDVRVRGERGEWAVDGVTLSVARGEIVGIAGVEGNGQRELALMLAGRLSPEQGRVRIPDAVAFVPQDRTREGLVAEFDLTANVALALHGLAEFRRGPFLRWNALRARTDELLRRFDVRAPDAGTAAGTLSGGNQQRLLLARELSLAAELVVAENPTRGLDVGAAAFVHRELRALASTPGGPAVVLLSTDLDEVLALAHRVLVMVRGRLVEVPQRERTRQGVGAYMLGGARA